MLERIRVAIIYLFMYVFESLQSVLDFRDSVTQRCLGVSVGSTVFLVYLTSARLELYVDESYKECDYSRSSFQYAHC